METRYPSRKDWLRFLANPDDCQGLVGIAFVGTIADILQLAEECKKGNGPMRLAAFEQLHNALRRGRIVTEGILHTLDLDREAILDAGFSGSPYEDEEAMTLWSEVATTAIRPWRTLRRLMLRPHDYRWWGSEPYHQMEEYFGEEQMADIAMDTDGLADFLAQYFGDARHGAASFAPSDWLSPPTVALINRILMDYRTDGSVSGFVVASTFGFLEIIRKWDVLRKGRIKPYQFRAFLDEPPEWFLVAAVDADLVPFFSRLPADVQMENGGIRSIERGLSQPGNLHNRHSIALRLMNILIFYFAGPR